MLRDGGTGLHTLGLCKPIVVGSLIGGLAREKLRITGVSHFDFLHRFSFTFLILILRHLSVFKYI